MIGMYILVGISVVTIVSMVIIRAKMSRTDRAAARIRAKRLEEEGIK